MSDDVALSKGHSDMSGLKPPGLMSCAEYGIHDLHVVVRSGLIFICPGVVSVDP